MMSSSAEEEEAKLLALVGGTVEDMSQYEEQVIQQAERSAAPLLTSSTSGVGFGGLVDALAPSYSARTGKNMNPADTAHFSSMLAKIRKQITKLSDESHRSQVLRLQEQMILVYLKQKLPKDEFPVQIPKEVAAEHQRKYQIQNHVPPDNDNADNAVTTEKRSNDNNTATQQQSPKRQRKTLQAWKKQQEIIQNDEDREKHKVLKQKRKERQERRRQRLAQILGAEEEDEEETVFEDDDEVDTKMPAATIKQEEYEEPQQQGDNSAQHDRIIKQEEQGDSSAQHERIKQEEQGDSSAQHERIKQEDGPIDLTASPQHHHIKQEDGPIDLTASPPASPQHQQYNIKQEEAPVATAAAAPQQHQVECPMCQQQISYSDGDQPDTALSQHMDQCPRSGRRRRSRPKSYAEESFGDNDEEDYKQPPPPSTRALSRRSSTKKTINVPKKKTKRLPPTVSAALDDLEEWVYEDRVDDWIETGVSKMKAMAERDEKEVPPGAVVYANDLHIPAWVNNRLFEYQRTGLQWMWELHQQEAGGIVGDEMGLGKTVQVCSYLGCMAASRKLKSVLIVCPATILQHWLKELAIWAPGLRRILIHKSGETDGASRNFSATMLKSLTAWLKRARADRVYEPIDEQDFVDSEEDAFVGTGFAFVTTYENLRRYPDAWTAHRWSYVVLDEGQKIRNPDSDITLVCKRLRTPHRLLLSGTPIQNDLKELWTLFDFVFPGRLGTLPAFESEFAEPIKRGGFSNASPMQVQLAYRCALVLKDLINPYLLRRQKKDIEEVSRMPGKTEQVLFCRLSTRQRELYEAYLRSDEVTNILRGSALLFRAITNLRKICNHPDLVCDPTESAYQSFVKSGFNQVTDSGDSDEDEEIDDFESLVERSGKLEVLAKILPLWEKQGHRVLIFCQWTKMLNILQGFIMAQGWKFGRMDGKTSVASRQNLVDTFNADESYFALLMTTRTGGVGLNLTGADRVIIYDPDWNPQTDSQARARSHRFGQTRPVTIYRLITAGTIEEKIYHRQIFKTALTNKVLQDPKQKRLFSQRDLRDFFTLKADDGSIIKGGQGVTELGTITRGKGVINPEELARGNGADDDDDKETLETVMKSKGLAGVFDHDFVDRSDVKKSVTVREMEDTAKKVAAEAVKTLKASAQENRDRFQPTYTGSEETSAGRFGHGGMLARRSSSSILRRQETENSFGGAGVTRRDSGAAPSSKSLLAGLKGMNPTNGGDKDANRYADLLKRVQTYVRRCGGYRQGGGPTTDEVLKEFDDVPADEAAVFRRLLSSVAKVERGKWRLKE